jgi:hypothetical protein
MARGGPRPNSGGKRPGAGRKKGAAAAKSRKANETAQAAAGEGPLPLQVLLDIMRRHYAAEEWKEAAAIAALAAPYVHPRLTAARDETNVEVRTVHECVIAPHARLDTPDRVGPAAAAGPWEHPNGHAEET